MGHINYGLFDTIGGALSTVGDMFPKSAIATITGIGGMAGIC